MPNPARTWRDLPKPVRFLLAHGAVGFVISALFVGALLVANPGDTGQLLLTAVGHWWPAVALWLYTGLAFGTVQVAMATMLLATAEPRQPPGGSRAPALAPALLRLRARP
jgi:hypothetical protein